MPCTPWRSRMARRRCACHGRRRAVRGPACTRPTTITTRGAERQLITERDNSDAAVTATPNGQSHPRKPHGTPLKTDTNRAHLGSASAAIAAWRRLFRDRALLLPSVFGSGLDSCFWPSRISENMFYPACTQGTRPRTWPPGGDMLDAVPTVQKKHKHVLGRGGL